MPTLKLNDQDVETLVNALDEYETWCANQALPEESEPNWYTEEIERSQNLRKRLRPPMEKV